MDIFSAGCVIAELFTEGSPPFDLSQLLEYRSKEYSPWKLLEKIDDTDIRVRLRHHRHFGGSRTILDLDSYFASELTTSCFPQELVRHMLQKEQSLRLSAEEYLRQQNGKAFPEYFFTFLKLYMQRYAISPILSSDDRVARSVIATDFMDVSTATDAFQGTWLALMKFCDPRRLQVSSSQNTVGVGPLSENRDCRQL